MTPNEWNHVMMTYDGSQSNFYLNGSLDRSENIVSSVCQNNGPVTIGGKPAAYTPFAGSIDEVIIYDHALSAEEIETLYSNRPSGDNVPWLSKAPISGTVTANGSKQVQVAFDAAGLQPDACHASPQT